MLSMSSSFRLKKWLIFIPSTHRVDVIKQTLLRDFNLTFLIFENIFILTVLDLVAGRITARKVENGVFRQHTVSVLELVELVGDFCVVTARVAGVLKKQIRNNKLIKKLTDGQSSFPVG